MCTTEERTKNVGHEDTKEVHFFFEQTRKQIEHEDNLVNQRLTWFLQANGFLFAAFAFSLVAQATFMGKTPATEGTEMLSLINTVRSILALIGMAASCLSLVGIWAAHLSIKDLIRHWHEKYKGVCDNYPQISGGNCVGNINLFGSLPARLMPGVLLICWLYLI